MSDATNSGALCGLVDKAFSVVTNFLSYIDTGKAISFSAKDKDSVTLSYTRGVKMYGVSLEFPSTRRFQARDSIYDLFKRLKNEEEARVMLNFVKNDYESFVHVFSTNKSIIDSAAHSFGVKPMSGEDIVRSMGAYFLFNSYVIEHNVLKNQFDGFIQGVVENMQFHRVSEMLSRNVLRKSDIYQAIAMKERDFNVLDLFRIEGWNGSLSVFFDFSMKGAEMKFKLNKDEAGFFDAKRSNVIKKLEDTSYDHFKREYIIANAILTSNDKKYISQIESCTGLLFEENYLSGVQSYKNTLLNKRDTMFDFYVSIATAKNFFQSAKKRIEVPTQRSDRSWILPDFHGKDSSGMFMNYALGANVNPHLLIIAKTGSGKSSALLKILRSAGYFDDNFYSELFDEGEIKMRYLDIDYSAGRFVLKLNEQHPGKVKVYGSNVSKMRFCLLDIAQSDEKDLYSPPVESEIKEVCAFVNMVLEATDAKSVLDNAEEDRFQEAIRIVFTDHSRRVLNKTIGEFIDVPGYESLCAQILKDYPQSTKLFELDERYRFLQKPTLKNVIDYVDSMSRASSISEIQRNVYGTLHKKINGLSIFNFASHANVDISKDHSMFYADLGELKSNQKEFVSLGWMLLKSWTKIDRRIYNERSAKGLPRQKIFYIVEESHNFFTVPSFKKLFQESVKELRKFGIHIVFVSHTIHDLPKDIYKSIATKIFLFTEGDADAVKQEIEVNATVKDERLEVFKEATKDDYALFIMHDKGESVCKLNMTQQDLETYVPMRIEAD